MKRNQKKHTLQAAQGERAIKTHSGHNDSSPLKLLTPELLLIGIFIVALSIRLLYPEHAGAQFNLGMAYTSKGMRNEAITQFKKAIALDPKLKAAYKKLGLEE